MSDTPDYADVELKANVAGAAVAVAAAAFDLAEDDAKSRRIWFGEVPVAAGGRPPLSARGLIVRVRTSRKKATATLKLRGPDGSIDVAGWRALSATWGDRAKVEGDWSGDRHLVSASLDNEVEIGPDDPPPHAAADLDAFLSGEQRDLAARCLLPLGRLRPLGPVAADIWSVAVPGLPDEVTFERWVVEDLRFLELSLRVPTADAPAVQAALLAALTDRGLPADPAAATKTETVLARLAAVSSASTRR